LIFSALFFRGHCGPDGRRTQKGTGQLIFSVTLYYHNDWTATEFRMLKNFKYIIYKEGKHYVSKCLNIDVASFGDTIDEAIANLKEALELYHED
jgi:hypothetical protein